MIDPLSKANTFNFVRFLFIFSPHPFISPLNQLKQMNKRHLFRININFDTKMHILDGLQFPNFHNPPQRLFIENWRINWLALFGLGLCLFKIIVLSWLSDFIGVYPKLGNKLVIFFLKIDVWLCEQLYVKSLLSLWEFSEIELHILPL